MVNGLIGKKIGMTQFFDEEARMVIGTVIEAGPCYIVNKKTVDKDGYEAIQLGYEETKPQRVNKAILGHFKKAKVPTLRHLREFEASDVEDLKMGDVIKADIFNEGDLIDVSGISKGKGFAGTMKRHGFSGQPESHGGMAHRRPGSIGQASYPGRVWKGIKMAGRMGGEKVTITATKVVAIDPEKNIIVVKGSVPGPNGGTIIVKHSERGVN